jgi:6-phosphogluconolactonase
MSDAPSPEFLAFESREQASAALADALAARLAAAIHDRGRAALVVSGGSSPVAMFRALREKDLPWSSLTVVPSDERDVPENHPDRNDAMIQRELLAGPAEAARLVCLIPPGDLPDGFDAVVLGMGADGHTASLFPGSPQLHQALASDRPLEMLEVPQLGVRRVSLTPMALLNSDAVYLLIFGDEKRRVYESALERGDVDLLPVRAVLRQRRVPLTVFWAS